MKELVYIAGYGRSGSTIIERILSADSTLVGLGELAYLYDNDYADKLWAKAIKLQFWRDAEKIVRVRGSHLDYASRLQSRNESILWSLLRGLTRFTPEYIALQRDLFIKISGLLPENVRYIIDSSKTARNRFGRPFGLRKALDGKVKVIHVYRNPLGCLKSIKRGSNYEMEGLASASRYGLTLRVLLGWVMANASGIIYSSLYRNKEYLLVSYEKFMASPMTELDRIGRFLDVDLTYVIRAIEQEHPFPQAPQFAGNRLRTESSIKLKRNPVDAKQYNLSVRLLYFVIAGPMLRYMDRRS